MRKQLLLLALVACIPASAMAQGDSAGTAAAACAGQKDGLVLNAAFSSQADFARVLLCAGATYRAETSSGGVRLSAKSLLPGVQSPRFTEMLAGGNSNLGGGALYKLLAYADGVYEIRVVSSKPGAQVTLKVTRTGGK